VHAAPDRRVDNLITRTHDAAAMLRMHAVVAEEARATHAALRFRSYALCASLLALNLSGTAAALGMELELMHVGGVGAAGLAAAALAAARAASVLRDAREAALSDDGLDAAFERRHALEVAEQDEFVLALWWRVRPQLQTALRTLGLEQVPRLAKADVEALDAVLHVEVPALRRLAAPSSPPPGIS
jgi:hypothetical protein